MEYKQFFLRELDREAPIVRKMLERVPDDKFDWRPHDKSTKLGTLAAHVATLPIFVVSVLTTDSIDVSNFKSPEMPKTQAELLTSSGELIARARETLMSASEEEFDKMWSLRFKDQVISSLSKADTLQSLFFNHIVHHRAQLGVYLRLLDIAIPATYGPSADEQ